MSNYYISDTHFGHYNILKLCNRPFESVEQMNETMIENWNRTVRENDHVYILGDVIYKSPEDAVKLLQKLNGKKHLIVGNHDGVIMKNQKALDLFESVDYYKEIIDDGKRIILCHYPMVEWNCFFRNAIHLYGHIHNNTKNETYNIVKNLPNAYNVGADILNFTPQKLNKVMQYNKKFNDRNAGQ